MTLTLTPQQDRAKQRIIEWWEDGHPETTLTGYAGTGKSTVIGDIIDSLDVNALYVAPTGRAAAVLRRKTGRFARTIHSVLYTPVNHKEPKTGPDGKPVLDDEGKPVMVDRLSFDLRRDPHEDIEQCDVIVVDEMSMVAEKEADNLRSLGKRIIAVGDPGQLPPVKANPGFVPQVIDLTDVVRQAQGSPVLEIATRIRCGEKPGTSGTSGMVRGFSRSMVPFFAEGDRQIVCWRHSARWAANRMVRSQARRRGQVPEGGEKISILRNNPAFDVYRGQQYTVSWTRYEPGGEVPHHVEACLAGEDGLETTVRLLTAGFADREGERTAELAGGEEFVAATWGYAVTVHSAQGSEWKDVLVLDHPLARPRDQRMDRWLYTAVTRASERVMIAREGVVL